MTTHQIFLQNIQCEDSMASLKSALLKAAGITAVDFIKTENKVSISGISAGREEIVSVLGLLGYNEKENSAVFSRKNSFDYWYCYCCSGCDS